MLKWLKQFWSDYTETLYMIKMQGGNPDFDEEGDYIGEGSTHPVDVFFDMLCSWFLVMHCQHDRMVDDGYAGPDSGCIDMRCLDCGMS